MPSSPAPPTEEGRAPLAPDATDERPPVPPPAVVAGRFTSAGSAPADLDPVVGAPFETAPERDSGIDDLTPPLLAIASTLLSIMLPW